LAPPVGWVSGHPEITPPSNFHHFRDTTFKEISLAPVFVYGSLRSGTTLFRLMLDAHEEISNPGEADFLFDHLRRDPTHRGGWRYDRASLEADWIFRSSGITLPPGEDGLGLLRHMILELRRRKDGVLSLNIHRHAAIIAEVLPTARFIHLLRDPRDVARSTIGMGWVGTSYHGAFYWLDAEEAWDAAAIQEDRVLTVRFETLMAAVKPELARVCEFFGVAFSPKMLRYHLNTTYGPPDPKIAQSWKRKAAPREIALIEGRVGPLMAARGYAPNGPPHVPAGLEKRLLDVTNRLLRWRFNIRRYGLALFAGTHAARLLGLRDMHRSLRLRQEEILVRHLK
jgi:hypothetical protein